MIEIENGAMGKTKWYSSIDRKDAFSSVLKVDKAVIWWKTILKSTFNITKVMISSKDNVNLKQTAGVCKRGKGKLLVWVPPTVVSCKNTHTHTCDSRQLTMHAPANKAAVKQERFTSPKKEAVTLTLSLSLIPALILSYLSHLVCHTLHI